MTIRINDSVEITGDEDYNFESHPDEGYLTRLLNRREKQLARVLRTARRDGDVLRDMAKVMLGKHGLSQAGIIRMFDQYMELTRKVVKAAFQETQNENGTRAGERTESIQEE